MPWNLVNNKVTTLQRASHLLFQVPILLTYQLLTTICVPILHTYLQADPGLWSFKLIGFCTLRKSMQNCNFKVRYKVLKGAHANERLKFL